MAQTNSPESRAAPGQEPLPRLLQLGEEILVFEGLQEAAEQEGETSGTYSREDCLILPQIGSMVMNVAWGNHQRRHVRGKDLTDPYHPFATFMPYHMTNQIFGASLNIAPEVLQALWEEQEDRFMHSEKAAGNGETPRAEYIKLLTASLTAGIKLELSTPTGFYVSHAESQTKRPIEFSRFRPFGWELFADESPDPRYLYIPNPANLGQLRARFTASDPGFAGSAARPLVGGRSI